MSSPNLSKPINRLLAALPREDYQRLCLYLEPVELPQHKILYHAGENYDYAYFPSHSIVSTVAIMEDGSTTEIGVIGNEGMVGLPIVLDTSYTNSTAIVQVGNGGYRISAQELQNEINRQGALKRLLMRYIQARIIQLGQTAACNRHHNLEQRFARWLLTVRDNIQKDEFQLTQEFISQMLGVRRTGVTEVAHKFQKAGIIHYKRGLIHIDDREKLEARTCECYWLIAKEFSRLLD
ncbi:Crp/Fnr family transcriptional regulator [Waterburya agarophytonicola K14]|uniref:Crp/Fnr family transcriptional regulator n=1 Tax=Waterburya agarophytonicola KI4 TaxID=2874699 RepID=A0A964BXC1_9CYAN|nr:Crp/Fnr family transcriptional regulator [Waterburya agarophytonicola]MCC0179075.1 Crp/Fnr family transcriptional regulator [Waterburya agarophytonicola KI4]